MTLVCDLHKEFNEQRRSTEETLNTKTKKREKLNLGGIAAAADSISIYQRFNGEQFKLDLGYKIFNRGYGGDREAQQSQCKLSVMRAGRKKKIDALC